MVQVTQACRHRSCIFIQLCRELHLRRASDGNSYLPGRIRKDRNTSQQLALGEFLYMQGKLARAATKDDGSISPQYNLLMLAIGNLFWVPFSVKFGKRPVLLTAMLLLMCSQIWAAKAISFNSLLGARFLNGFAASAGEVSRQSFTCRRAGVPLTIVCGLPRVSCQPLSPTFSFSTNVLQ